MSQFSISLNVSENDDGSHVGNGVHGRQSNDRRVWSTTPHPHLAAVPQYPPSVPEDDGTYMKPLTHHPCDSHHVRLLAVSNHISSGC